MKVYLASDHTGLKEKESLKNFLQEKGYDVQDCGAYSYDKDDDYPDFIAKAAEEVSKDPSSIGFIFGGSGQGEQMTANKLRGVRCALFYSEAKPITAIDITGAKSDDSYEIIKLSRQHNDANMLSFGVRFLNIEQILKAAEIFLNTPFLDEARHVRRIDKIKAVENGQ